MENLMMFAGRKLADQAFRITESQLRRLVGLKRKYYSETPESEIDEDICRVKDRLKSIQHVADMRQR